MPRMMIVDTYYPEFIESVGPFEHSSYPMDYEHALKFVMNHQFGTGDFYSKHLREFGWEVQDVVANFKPLQALWAQEFERTHDWKVGDIVAAQIEEFKPDIIFLQDLGCLGYKLPLLKDQYLIAGQSSCAIRRELIPNFKVIFTSFPHFVRKYGNNPYCKFVFNPLAFEPSVLDGIDTPGRNLDISFVGGVGAPGHWNAGMNMLEAVATEFPDKFKWWGYGANNLNVNSRLHGCYQGSAWGRDMYSIYSQSKIVINRHGEISERYANNMRMYEATGCGALLITEAKQNMRDLFELDEVVTYTSPEHMIRQLDYYLSHTYQIPEIAERGRKRTLTDHTYRERMKTVSDTLLEMI